MKPTLVVAVLIGVCAPAPVQNPGEYYERSADEVFRLNQEADGQYSFQRAGDSAPASRWVRDGQRLKNTSTGVVMVGSDDWLTLVGESSGKSTTTWIRSAKFRFVEASERRAKAKLEVAVPAPRAAGEQHIKVDLVKVDGNSTKVAYTYTNKSEQTFTRSVVVECSLLDKKGALIDIKKRSFFVHDVGPIGPGWSRRNIVEFGDRADSASCQVVEAI